MDTRRPRVPLFLSRGDANLAAHGSQPDTKRPHSHMQTHTRLIRTAVISAAAITTAWLATSCSGPRARDFKTGSAPVDPLLYFTGRTQSWGLVENRFGKVLDQFSTEMRGEMRGTALRLVQDFSYTSGKKQHREWDIRPVGGHRYEGTANDTIGTARGEVRGNAFEWNYALAIPVGKGSTRVDFTQIMLLQEDGVLLNRVRFSKLGVRLGDVSEFFIKPDAPPSSPARRLKAAASRISAH